MVHLSNKRCRIAAKQIELLVAIDLRAFFLDDRTWSQLTFELSSKHVRSFACMPHGDSNGGLVFGFHLRDGCELNGLLTCLVANGCIHLFNDGSVRQNALTWSQGRALQVLEVN